MPEALLAMFRNGPGVVGDVIHRFDRDEDERLNPEDERLNPYLSNGYTLKKPRVEKRTLGETPANRSRPTKRVQPDVTQGDDSRVGNLTISDDGGAGVSPLDFKPSGGLEPEGVPSRELELEGVGGPLYESRRRRAPPSQGSGEGTETPSESRDDAGDSDDQPLGTLAHVLSYVPGLGGNSSKQTETPISGKPTELRKGMLSRLNPWSRSTPSEAEEKSLELERERERLELEREQESLRLNQEALEEEQLEFKGRVKREEGNIKVSFEEIEKEAERVGALTDQLQSEIAGSKRLQKNLQAELGEAEALRKRYEGGLAKLKKDETKLTERDARLTAIHEQIQAQSGTVDSLTKDIEQRQRDLSELNTKIGSLEFDVFSLEADKREVERLQRLKTRATAATKRLQEEYERKEGKLEAQIREKQQEFDELQANLGTIKALQSALGQKEGEIEALKQEKIQLTKQHGEELSRNVSASQTRALEAEQLGEEQKGEISRLNERIAELTGQLEKNKTDWQSEKKSFEQEIDEKSAEIEELTRKVEKKKSVVKDLEELEQELQTQKNIVNNLDRLLDIAFVADFLPILAYVREKIGSGNSFSSDLVNIFFTEKDPGKFERVDDPITVLERVEKRFELDDSQIEKIEGKASYKRWVEEHGV
jgi:hypothetical protein